MYSQQVRDIEDGVFTPLVLSRTGGMRYHKPSQVFGSSTEEEVLLEPCSIVTDQSKICGPPSSVASKIHGSCQMCFMCLSTIWLLTPSPEKPEVQNIVWF